MISPEFLQQVTRYLAELYPAEDASELAARCIEAVGIDVTHAPLESQGSLWDSTDIVLITYADSIVSSSQTPLNTINDFLNSYLKETVSVVHILPFFPYSSDDGFSVIDYSTVNPSHGNWEQLTQIKTNFKLMVDLVLNHCSTRSLWFENFKTGNDPGRNFFITAAADTDTSQVIRPRTSDLLRPTRTSSGEIFVWCTFSHDQVDLNFRSPDVLLEFLKIIRLYLEQGVEWFRLDAVGFIWKELGTSCINLPEAHTIIKLLRLLIENRSKGSVIVTETNIPNSENLTYFGELDEAHLIYNFSLPPLLVNTLATGDYSHLQQWIKTMPPARPGTAYLNFLASHDGVGLRPAEGLLSREEIESLTQTMVAFGGRLSYRAAQSGKQEPYEINISLWDALAGTTRGGRDQYQFDRFICAHAILLALEGIPAFYIHSLFATENDVSRVENTGNLRSINRHVWELEELEHRLADENYHHGLVFNQLTQLIMLRKRCKAFHPNATMFTLHLADSVFGFWRQSLDREQDIFAVFNVTDAAIPFDLSGLNLTIDNVWVDLVSGSTFEDTTGSIELRPYQFLWISNK